MSRKTSRWLVAKRGKAGITALVASVVLLTAVSLIAGTQ